MSAPGSRGKRERRDQWIVAAATLAAFGLASVFELHEWLARWLAGHERWQADELMLALVVLALGLVWYGGRRRSETGAALALREQAQAHADDLLQRNRVLSQQLISAHETERRALSRDLHDEFGQSCTMIRLEMAQVRRGLEAVPADPVALRAAVDRADRTAEQLHRGVRDMLRQLRPAELDALGLTAALQQLCEDWERRSGVACLFFHDLAPRALGDAADITLYRVTQEALSNVMRHAGATQVRITLTHDGAQAVVLTVVDDGRGMDPEAPTAGLGLLGARERAAAAGGELTLAARPGQGTRIALRLPGAAADAPASR